MFPRQISVPGLAYFTVQKLWGQAPLCLSLGGIKVQIPPRPVGGEEGKRSLIPSDDGYHGSTLCTPSMMMDTMDPRYVPPQ